MEGIAASSNGGNRTQNQNQTIHSHLVSHLQSFEANPEIYSLTAGMEMMASSYQSRNNLQQQNSAVLWRGFFNNNSNNRPGTSGGSDSGGGPGPSTSNKELSVPAASSDDDQFYHHDLTANEALMVSPPLDWTNHHNRLANADDPYHSLRSCVFPCKGNERPSQGLSLSLSSSNPSRVTLQSFELRQHPSSASHLMQQEQYSHIRNSRYLGPAQELLNEFCSLGLKQTDGHTSRNIKPQKSNDQDNQISDVTKQSLCSLDLLELQIRKTKLIQMLEEVDRRYKHYCDRMKAVASSFEAAAGNGAAAVYSSMASRAMSRHFRCLRDGIMNQLKATKKAIEDKNTAAPGYTMKGETPRLRLLDQKLRQQKALQQMSMMEAHPWRPQRGLPERSVSALRAWLFEHFLHPYPTDVDKHILSRQTGLSRSQVSNWFINARVRLWKPMVEEMYSAELKENGDENLDRSKHDDDQKPALDRTNRKDSDSLSSIVNSNPSDRKNSYGAMELDFSSYGGGSSGGGVSLTLGLHQHGGNGGVGSSSLFYTRDQMEDCQTVHHQYSLLESDQSQHLPYRNLMGAQLLHDLAG